MAQYHPGRRKRQQIMNDLAHGAAFNHGKGRRLSYEERQALEAAVECWRAFDKTGANRTVVDKAVEIVINKRKNKAREVIKALEAKGLLEFERKPNGMCIKIPESTQIAFRQLEILERMISRTVLAEDGHADLDVTQDVASLKALNIYCGSTDEELDAGMEKQILKNLGGKMDEEGNEEAKQRSNNKEVHDIGHYDDPGTRGALPRMLLSALGVLLITVMVIATPDMARADKAGTVGLGPIYHLTLR